MRSLSDTKVLFNRISLDMHPRNAFANHLCARSMLTISPPDTVENTIRLAVVATHPIQYQCPVWRELSQVPGLVLSVFFGSDFSVRGYRDSGFGQEIFWTIPLLDGYQSQSLGSAQIRSGLFFGSFRLWSQLRAFRPTACLINGYSPLFYWHAVAVCWLLGVPVMMRAETTDRDRDRGLIHRFVRDVGLRVFYSQITCFLAIGHNSRSHYRRLGVGESRIGFAPYCVDTALFEQQYQLRKKGGLRAKLCIPLNAVVVLFSGKLIPKKDPLTLLRAIQKIPLLESREVHLVFLGDGELRPALERAAADALHKSVHFLGFQPQEKLGETYTDADILVLPSVVSETWGLVVNEAMQFGLPCIVSDRVGCGPDLVSDGQTGFIFPHGDAGALCQKIVAMAKLLDAQREKIQLACRDRASNYSVYSAAGGIAVACKQIVSRPCPAT